MTRLEYWKTQKLSEMERKAISDIEKHGVHLIEVPEDDEGPGFVFSMGLFDNFSHPEIIIVGLDGELSLDIINGLAQEVREGKKFRDQDRHDGILEDYTCVFLDVAKANFAEHLGYAMWYYGDTEFPALQCVWPDMDGSYPWDGAATEEFIEDQPILA